MIKIFDRSVGTSKESIVCAGTIGGTRLPQHGRIEFVRGQQGLLIGLSPRQRPDNYQAWTTAVVTLHDAGRPRER